MIRSSRNRILRRNAQRSDNMGATMSINEIKPSEVRMDSKHIDKIIRMAAEIDRYVEGRAISAAHPGKPPIASLA